MLADYSYETFRKYLDMVHAYANTTSLQMQMTPVQVNQLSIGDVFIMTAQQMSNDYGHAAIIVDMAVHKETGEKIFLVAEGNMPATETYIVLNDDEMMGAWHKLNNNLSLLRMSGYVLPSLSGGLDESQEKICNCCSLMCCGSFYSLSLSNFMLQSRRST